MSTYIKTKYFHLKENNYILINQIIKDINNLFNKEVIILQCLHIADIRRANMYIRYNIIAKNKVIFNYFLYTLKQRLKTINLLERCLKLCA